MEETVQDVTSEIRRYLRTGASDLFYEAWPGQNFFERAERGRQDLRGALTAEVFRRTQGASQASVPTDTVALTRRKVEPMVRGLFPRVEQDVVLALLEKSVIFLTPTSIESLLLDHPIDRPAWDLANLYLGSCGAELMAEDGPRLVGMSEGTTCYVSLEYFIEDDPFADFIVHEAAHIFHNCKRVTAGLKRTRTREWLLNIEYRKRETFAYACEAYSRILERAQNPAERRALASEFGSELQIPDERVDAAELASIVREAAAVRNGWKVILRLCAGKKSKAEPHPW